MIWGNSPRVTTTASPPPSYHQTHLSCTSSSPGHLPHVDFEALYRETYLRVVAYARSMASREDADDAVAETYAIAWRRQRDIPRGVELGWLIGVTRRVLANARRPAAGPVRCTRCSISSRRSPGPTRRTASRTSRCAPRCSSCRRSTAKPSY